MSVKLYGRWQVTLPDGESYVWEPDETTVGEQLMLEAELGGLSFEQWVADIDSRKGLACQVLVWFLRRKAGKQQDRTAVNFPIRRLDLEPITDDAEGDVSGEASADSASATSSPSSTGTVSGPGNGTGSPDTTS